jgi:hypothetical protein
MNWIGKVKKVEILITNKRDLDFSGFIGNGEFVKTAAGLTLRPA